MQSPELCFPVINVVFSLPQVEVDDVDGVDLAHLVVIIAQVDVFGDGFGYAVEHAVEVIQFAVVLHLDDEQAATAVLHQHIGPVELVGGVRLVGFAFQEAFDAQVFSQQGREEAFQYHVVAFVPQQPFHGPIEAYQVVFHISSLFIGGINSTDKTSSLSKIIIDGQGYATLGSLKPLIVNNGDLRITGNLEIKGGYNTNESASGALAPGGAIYNTGKLFWVNVLISDCRYLNYVANISQFGAGGGAIYNTGTLDLINGSIQNCLARGGGAIYSSGTLNIDSLRFMGNNSSSRTMLGSETHAGHTIKLVGGKANISNTVITSSSISNGTTTGNQGSAEMVVDKIGGAIYVGKDAELFLSDTNISKCYAYQGGGLYVDGKAILVGVSISNCQVKNGGQGIMVGSTGKLVTIKTSIGRCYTNSNPSGIGVETNGVLTVTGGQSSLLSLEYEGDINSTATIPGNNNTYGVAVAFAMLLCAMVFVGLMIRKKYR